MRPYEIAVAIFGVLKVVFKISPVTIGIKFFKSIIDSILPLATAFFAASTITNLTLAAGGDERAKSLAILFIVLTTLSGLISSLLNSIGSYIDEIMRFKVDAKVSDILYERFIRLDFWRYEDKKTTELYDKAQDFARFFAYVFDRIMGLLTALFGVLSALVALGFITPWLSLIFSLAIIPGLVVQYRITRLNISHWRNSVTDRQKKSFIEYNMIQPKIISELRLYNLATTMLKLRAMYRNRDQGKRLQFEKGFIKWRILGDSLEAAVELGTLLWTVLQIVNNKMPLGQFIYVQQLASRALGSANQFISQFGAADEDLAKLKDFNDFMMLPVKDTVGLHRLKKMEEIVFEDVSFSYPGSDKLVLDQVSFKISRGEHIALVGENGAGKSTLLKLLLGFYEPTDGRVLINGIDLKDIHLASWHKQIGVLLQDFTSFQFTTAGENVRFGDVMAKMTSKRVNDALREAEAKQVVDGLPRGLDTPLAPWMEEEGAADLSGGQWQRLGLARNFYRQAPIVVLDEPTSAIDALAEAKIFDRLFDKKNEKTLIAISHRLTTIEQADRIYVIDQGRIVQQGTHTELAAQKSGQYATMFRRQLKNS